MFHSLTLAVALGVFVVTWIGCRVLETIFTQRGILDHPNPRSNHHIPKPRGAGIAVMIGWLGGVVILDFFSTIDTLPLHLSWLFLALVALITISWIDDLRTLPAALRLPIHILAALIALPSLPGPLFADMPGWFNITVTCILWVWFANIYNFMDGIDGISGVQGLALCGGLLIFTGLLPEIAPLGPLVLLLGAALVSFLGHNWPPARIFLGDVGSIPIGFILGWALLWLAIEGQPIAAIILPLYYFADSGLTFLRRLLAGKRVWHPHSEHAYQQAARQNMSHAHICRCIGLANIILIAFALTSFAPERAVIALIGAIVCVVLLLCHLSGEQQTGEHQIQAKNGPRNA